MHPWNLNMAGWVKPSAASAVFGVMALLLLVCAERSSAATRYVAQAGQTPESPYATWTTAASNVQDAVDAAAEGDGVLISNGTYSAAVNLEAKNLHFDAVGSAILSGGFLGTAGLTKLGSGELTLAASNAYEGATVVTGGVLAVVHSNALYGTTNLYIGSGAVVSNVSEDAYAGGFWRGNVTNRWAKVSGAGSVWVVKTNLTIGSYGLTSGNRLEIEAGGSVATLAAVVGAQVSAVSNTVIVSGPGSVWTNSGALSLGQYGSGNCLVVSNGGQLSTFFMGMGERAESRKNVMIVTGPGSQAQILKELYVGQYNGSENMIRVSDGAYVYTSNGAHIGFGGVSNSVVLEGPQTYWWVEGSYAKINLGYYGSYNSLTVSNQASLNGGVDVGNQGHGNRLLVNDGVRWTNGYSLRLGPGTSGGSHNEALITGNSQVRVGYVEFGWGMSNRLVLSGTGTTLRTTVLSTGLRGRESSLIVSSGACLTTVFMTYVGASTGTNLMQVTGAGSAWYNVGGSVYIGTGGDNNRLEISDDAFVFNTNALVGGTSTTTGHLNGVTVSGGASWSNGTVYVGYQGSGNWVRVTSGGQLDATNFYVGCMPNYEGNHLVVSGGMLNVRRLLEVRNGSNVLNRGTLFAGNLLMTNAGGIFVFDGGVLSAWTTTVNNGQAFLVGDGLQPARYELFGQANSFADGLIFNAQTTLAGTGSVQSAVTMGSGSVLSPAYTGQVGTLTIDRLSLSNGAEYVYEKSAAAGDTINVTGTLSFVDAPVVTIRLVDLGGADFTNGAVLFTAAAVEGAPSWQIDLGETTATNLAVRRQGDRYLLMTANPAGIGLSTSALSYTATYGGANPAAQSWIVTNLGELTMAYTNEIGYGVGGSGWFGGASSTGRLAGGGAQAHTGTVLLAGLSAGTYTATNAVLSAAATNSPQTLTVTLTIEKADQTISSFAPTNDSVFLTSHVVQLSASASSGLPVSFTNQGLAANWLDATTLVFATHGTACVVAAQTGNANYHAAPARTNFYIVHGVPSVGPTTVFRVTNQVLKVTDTMMLTNAVDPEASPLSVVWVSPASTNGGTMVLDGRWLVYTPPLGNDAPDYFQFRVCNAFGGIAEGRAEVLVIVPATGDGQTHNIVSVTPSGSDVLVHFAGIAGRSYRVQATTNLVVPAWTNIGQATIGALGYVIFTDTNPPVSRYYRTTTPDGP
ncbi:MAG TPA: hypothetical protein DCZ95_11530 [Verrucomicrobia bacterium]|nr:MAG: hypothetical protein A2X46_04070 [Lentisphaerae bacterium GWF2_57_35]HBA84715.1 hypothetical protein [Verrucomicrobiota bacterium]